MYNKILKLNFEEALQVYSGVQMADSTRKIITIKDCMTEDTFPSASDIVIYYDIIGDSTPLLLVERMDKKKVNMWRMKSLIKKENAACGDYVISYSVSKDKKFVDVTAVKRNIYEKLTEA